jgi:hypothetical protein
MRFHLVHAGRNDGNEIVRENIAGTPDLHARGEAAEIPDLELTPAAASNAATGSNMRDFPNIHFGRKIAIIVDNGILADFEIFRMPDSTVGRNDRFHASAHADARFNHLLIGQIG